MKQLLKSILIFFMVTTPSLSLQSMVRAEVYRPHEQRMVEANREYDYGFGKKDITSQTIRAKPEVMAEIQRIAESQKAIEFQKINSQQTRIAEQSHIKPSAIQYATNKSAGFFPQRNQSPQPAQKWLATKEPGIYIPDRTNAITYHPEKMASENIGSYIEKFDSTVKAEYSLIPETIRSQVEPVYVAEAINVQSKGLLGGDILGYNKITPDQIALQDWRVERPSDLAKISAGFDALNKLQRENPQFNEIFKATDTSKFMSTTANEYFLALQEKFPHAPKEVLVTYTTMFLMEHANKYKPQRGYLNIPKPWTKDLNSPIATKTSDITSSPGWDVETKREFGEDIIIGKPSPQQKVFALLEAIEAVHAKTNIPSSPVSSFLWSAPRKLVTNPRQFMKEGINLGVEFAADTGTEMLQSPSPRLETVPAAPFLNPRAQQAIGRFTATAKNKTGITADLNNPTEIVRQVTNKAIQKATPLVIEYLKAPEAKSDPYAEPFFDPVTQKGLGNVLNTGLQVVAESVGTAARNSTVPHNLKVSTEPNPFEISSETHQAFSKAQENLVSAASHHGTNLANSTLESFGIKVPISDRAEVVRQGVNLGTQQLLSKAQEYVALPVETIYEDAVYHDRAYFDQATYDVAGEFIGSAIKTAASSLGLAPQVESMVEPLSRESKRLVQSEKVVESAEKFIDPIRDEKLSEMSKSEIASDEHFTQDVMKLEKELTNRSEKLETERPSSERTERDVTEIKSEVKTSTITGYITESFRKAAQAVAKSPERLKYFITGVIEKISITFGCTEAETARLQKNGDAEVSSLISNKDSWVNAKDQKDFNLKFNAWVESFIDKCSNLIGRDRPKDLQIIQIERDGNNPLTPKITLDYNTKQNFMRSVVVEYNGNSYKLKPEEISANTDGTYTITSELYNSPQQKSTFSSIVFNPLMSSTVESVASSPLGQMAETSSPGLLNKGREMISAGGQLSDGTITIRYNPKKNSVTTQIEKIMPDTSLVTTTREYSGINASKSIGQISETIQITGPQGGGLTLVDPFAPTIKMKYASNGGSNKTGFLETVEITHKNITGGKDLVFTAQPTDIQFNQESQTYSITARFNQEAQPQQKPTGLMDIAINEIKKFLPENLGDAAYQAAVKNLDSIYALNLLKHTMPDAYAQAIKYLLEPYAQAIQTVNIEFNPANKTVVTQVDHLMSDNSRTTTSRKYDPAQKDVHTMIHKLAATA